MRRIVAHVVLVALLSVPAAQAQQPRALVHGQAFSIPSKVMGERRPLVVSLPTGYDKDRGHYPVMYLLDGPGNIQHTAATAQFLTGNGVMPPMIIVGVGNTDRTRDLTPPVDVVNERFAQAGGADRFLEFIETELVPFVESEFSTAPYRMLVGHSFGGLTAVHAMFARPDLFDSYISISPSLWWNDGSLLKTARDYFETHDSFDRSLYITLGNEGGPMQSSFESFIEVLEKYAPADFEFDHRLMPDETHGTVPLRSTYQGLRMIFDGWSFPQELFANADIGGIEAHARRLTEKFGFPVRAPEATLNSLGYAVMGNGDLDTAIEIFRYNVKLYPESANVYDSLGEALEANDDFEGARDHYQKAVRRGRAADDPNTPVYEQHLDAVTRKLRNVS